MTTSTNLFYNKQLYLLQILEDTFGDLVTIIDISGKCIYANKLVDELFMIRKNLLNKNLYDIIHPDDCLLIREAIQIIGTTGQSHRFKYRIPISYSHIRYMDAIGILLPVFEEELQCILLVSRDVSEFNRLHQQLLQAQKMESLGTLTSGIAHDFNNILGIILGYVSRLEQFTENRDRFQKNVETILQAVERGMTITQMVLAFARKSDTMLQPINLNTLCGGLKRLIDETFPRTITCSLELCDTLPLIKANPNQLQQALISICVNARDAMPDGGTISIKTFTTDRYSIDTRVQEKSDQKYVAISISDNGIGMDESTKSRVFDPFFTTKENNQGTGLGLAVVWEIVKIHNGFIQVDSSPGNGSNFTIFFPLQANNIILPVTTTHDSSQSYTGSETILIVEDEVSLATLLGDALLDNGYKTLTARDGKEAVDLFCSHHKEISLVVIDIGLPHIDGFNTCQEMRKKKPSLKVVCSTGYIAADLNEKVRDARFNAVVRKPSNVEDILRVIRKVLDDDNFPSTINTI